MSVTVTSPISAGYVPNGATRAFAFNFKISTTAEIAVYQVLAGVATLINPSAYAVVLDADGEGGTVTFTVAPAVGTGTIYLVSAPLLTQTLALANDGPFTPSILNGALDRAAIRAVFLNFQVGRALKVPLNETDPGYPDAADRANNYLTHDGAGKPIPGISNAGIAGMLSDISTNALAIANEAGSRAAADTTLQNNINAEATLRLNADATEATARNNAIAASAAILQSNMTALLGLLGQGGASISAIDAVLTPEQFGAIGNGIANDTAAMQALGAAITAAGGGTIWMRPGANYLVGKQDFVNAGIYMWKGQDVLKILGCPRAVVIKGNGAKFTVASGLKYGTFDSSGIATAHTLPFSSSEACTTAIDGFLSIQNCTGPVVVEDFEIDGNSANLNWGGQFADGGWQLPGDLFFIWKNSGGLYMKNCQGHHGSRDGLQSLGAGTTFPDYGYNDNGHLINCAFEYNTRQGWSVSGGKGWKIINCKFNHTGMSSAEPAPGFSPPGAGIDLETLAPNYQIRDFVFEDCEIINNTGNGLNADGGDTARVEFRRCTFIGTVGWAMWMVKPWFRFYNCRIAGGWITNIARVLGDYGSPPPQAAPVFEDCEFTDDPTVSPTGTLYHTAASPNGALINNGGASLGESTFRRCHFRGGYKCFSFSATGGNFDNCSFDLGTTNSTLAAPNLTGHTVITAGTDISILSGGGGRLGKDITYNGVQQRAGSATYDPPSIAAGAMVTTTVSVPWARVRDQVIVTFSNLLQGIQLRGYVSTAFTTLAGIGVVTVQFSNPTAGAIDLASGTLNVTLVDRDGRIA